MTLYYIEEKYGHGYLRQYTFKEEHPLVYALRVFDDYAFENGIRAFMVSTNKPIVNKDGSLSYNGCLFCNYSDCFHQVY